MPFTPTTMTTFAPGRCRRSGDRGHRFCDRLSEGATGASLLAAGVGALLLAGCRGGAGETLSSLVEFDNLPRQTLAPADFEGGLEAGEHGPLGQPGPGPETADRGVEGGGRAVGPALPGGGLESDPGFSAAVEGSAAIVDPPPTVGMTPDGAAPADAGGTGEAPDIIVAPDLAAEWASPIEPGERYTVDGLIGQVNGRPLYVREFFLPIGDQLGAMGLRMSRAEFAAATRYVVREQLDRIIENELVLSAARRSLTEDQEQGLRYWIEQVRQDQARKMGGAEAVADAQLREERGVTLDEEVEQIKTRELMRRQLSEDVIQRVDVTWRDVQRYYRDHYAEFNPPAQIQLALIVVAGDDAATRDAVEAALAAGTPFEDVAREHSRLLRSRGGLLDVVPLPDGIDGTALTRWPEVDAVARSLEVDRHGGPVQPEGSPDLIWVHVKQRSDGTGRTLYEAQLEIEETLRAQRFDEELQKYLGELMREAGLDDRQTMEDILWFIAMSRWAPPA